MKIKLSWDYDSDEWDVRDHTGDRLTHSSRWDGEYISLSKHDEVLRVLRTVHAMLGDDDYLFARQEIEKFWEKYDE